MKYAKYAPVLFALPLLASNVRVYQTNSAGDEVHVIDPATNKVVQTIKDIEVPHGVTFDGQQLFFSQKGLMGGPAPVRRFLPHLMDLVLDRKINPGKVFDLELPLSDVSEGYRAMDERRAIKVLLQP